MSDALSNHADKLGKELADQCRQTLVDRLWYMRSRDQSAYETFMPRCNHYGWRDLDRRIYECAAQIARELGQGN